ncbi:MAG: GtrA family protein [Polaromonas sp.]|uniref:GtrA family protein n=1 Tax=Polaromonas sp. TaxID=1869339 RepID=UPI0025D64BA6|nr:GtrA family protein [Polaromonas sp.]MBI2725084.1 GtrA family protein [Polaromonas sp.]
MSNRIVGLVRGVFHGEHAAQQLIRHLIVGGSGVVFNWVAFSVLRHFTALGTLQSTLLVHAVLLATIFPLQKLFTFKKKKHGSRQAIRFLINDVGYITLDYLLAVAFIDMLGLPIWFGKGCGLAILTPLSFLSQRLWVFSDASKPEQPEA